MTEQIIEFIQNHWMLCSATALVMIMLFIEEMRGKASGLHNLSARDLTLLLNREDAIIIDLRAKKTFKDGHIISSMNITHTEIDKHLKKLGANKDKSIVLVDDNGSKTSAVTKKLRTHGFTKVYSLAGGILSWKDAKLPLSKI